MKKKIGSFFAVLFVGIFIGSNLKCQQVSQQVQKQNNAALGKQAGIDNQEKWKQIKKTASITISPEWEAPVNLGEPLNTTGWEDSVSVSPDGNVITFTYFRVDPIKLIFHKKLRVGGPARPEWPQEEPFNTYGADIYISEKIDGQWQEPQNIGAPVNRPDTADGDQWLSSDRKRIYFNSAEGGRKKGIYFAERKNKNGPWEKPIFLNNQINSGHEDENPYLSKDEKTLFFESARPGGYGKKDLYYSENVGGVWQKPVNMGERINSKADDVQPFISTDGQTFFFSRDGAIYRSKKQKNGSWSNPEKIASGDVGEPTMTDSGDLYFLHVYKSSDKEFDADIMMAKRR